MNENTKEIVDILIDDIIPNRFQPRLTFDIEALNELSASIKEHGLLQPLIVRQLEDRYEIIAGERRYKAASLAGLKKVPCIIMNLDDNESAEVAVIENIQRKEMTPLEEARSFKKILDRGYLTQEQLAKRMGKSQSNVANKLRLLNLDDIVQEAILTEKISERHARSLLKVENKEEQRKILKEIIEKRLTVKQTDELIKERYGKEEINLDNNLNQNINNNIAPTPEEINSIFKKVNPEKPKVQQVKQQYLSKPEVNIPGANLNENTYGNSNQENLQNNMFNNQSNTSTLPVNSISLSSLYDNSVNSNIKPISNVELSNMNSMNIQSKELQPSNNVGLSSMSPIEMQSQETQPSNNIENINTEIGQKVLMQSENDIKPNVSNDNILTNALNSIGSNTLNVVNPFQPKEEEQEVVNMFPTSPVNNMNLDINNIKNVAVDIIKEKPPVDMNALLSTDKNQTPTNKFFIDLDIKEEEEIPEKIKNAQKMLEELEQKLKLQELNVTTELKNLEHSYDLILRIDK